MAMADHNFGPIGDEPGDDLPRTFRREKEARAREAKERADRERAAAPNLSTAPDLKPVAASPKIYAEPIAAESAAADAPYPAVVRGFDVSVPALGQVFLQSGPRGHSSPHLVDRDPLAARRTSGDVLPRSHQNENLDRVWGIEQGYRITRPATASSFFISAGSRASGAVIIANSSALSEPIGHASCSRGKSLAKR